MIIFDDENGVIVEKHKDGSQSEFALDSAEGFELMSKAWLRAGWDTKYVYSFSWMGRPIIQLPEDMVRIQEVIWALQPDVIVETGVAHGGSLIFYASLFKAIGKGRAIGVELALRDHNRKAIMEHPLSEFIDIVDGSSTAPETIEMVREKIKPDENVMVILDANHTKEHVLAELKAYSSFISVGGYMVACDGIMEQVVGAPRTSPEWAHSNPKAAAIEFASSNSNFEIQEPSWPFNESHLKSRVTYWPSAFIKRIS
ncbi:cephalosporin hydroxylase [Maritalea mobilis]|uniref:Cephalosporin hydroxylase n=1 Tax=Maritalea mobilis TaxID=483324 RepID=A0A4R6VPC4_9HYPH|nr:cephalosporin hydroxylase [Maritalea mobilis]